jgi:hypothetical protein
VRSCDLRVAPFVAASLGPAGPSVTGDAHRRLVYRSLATAARDAGADVIFAETLLSLADADAALAAMRQLLKNDPDGQKAQTARNVVVLYAIKKDLVTEAESAVESYARHQPQSADDRFRMELLIADWYMRAKNFPAMATHATKMLEASKTFSQTNKSEVFRRDEMLLKSAAVLSDAYLKANQKDAAIATLKDMRRFAIELPSANLYKESTLR